MDFAIIFYFSMATQKERKPQALSIVVRINALPLAPIYYGSIKKVMIWLDAAALACGFKIFFEMRGCTETYKSNNDMKVQP